jgi:hypothetical protein
MIGPQNPSSLDLKGRPFLQNDSSIIAAFCSLGPKVIHNIHTGRQTLGALLADPL